MVALATVFAAFFVPNPLLAARIRALLSWRSGNRGVEPMRMKRERLLALLRSRAFAVPALTGSGVYFTAMSYNPSRYDRRGSFHAPATIEPIFIAIGAALLVLAVLVYRHGNRNSDIDATAPGNSQERR